jgi:hypothetical protein
MPGNVKGILKLLLALAIPTVLGLGFYYSQQQANKEVADYQKFQKEHPPVEKITVDNYELKEVDDANNLKWHLTAEKGTMEPETKDVDLKEVKMKYYDGAKVKMSFSAPAGVANEATRLVKLRAADGKLVCCEGADGSSKLQAPKVELTKKNQFIATGGVTILYPGVAKVTGASVIGSLDKTGDMKNFTISGGTHAVVGHI